ncbi:tripartite tricarboxylate transporter substrate binding protein [Variovorax sp. J31P179]|uniref:tripartite tricarboxylate transporter substrate binding protein n=1 Tax=Variovorax sp. J31P179 TaxID=3053508 RepID=UPI002578FD1F|nr:tripartite tricarboxylate transporter substrate binding protein [Variovorax sp. J31P179]MDM0085585.1 tripartite tricarboxylate transporter substrate binding protein [Variovorax sp. J31P179]
MPAFFPIPSLRRRAVAALTVAACLPLAALAADWKPDHPVTLVVPYSPGGGTDAQTRVVAKELQQIWGQPVIVENVPGADGVIGTRKVIDAKPNGLTLLVQLPSLTLIKHLPTFKGSDPLAQLAPVSAFSALPGVVTANAALPVKSMEQLVRYCKSAATPCSVGTTENMARLQARIMGEENALPTLVVANYKGGGQMITDLVANNISFAIAGSTAVLPFVKTGALRVVMTMGDKRSAVLPDVPTAIEAGYPSFDATTWYGLFAPKGTPAEIQEGIAAAVRQAVKREDVRKSLFTIGAEPVGNTPAEFAAMVQREAKRIDAQVKRFPLD